MQIFSKVYCFLPHAPSLLADHVNSKHTEQTVKRYHCIQLGFPQILLTTTFSCSFSSLVSFAFLFSLVSFAFCLCVCVCVFFLFFFFVFFLKWKIYILDTHSTMRAGMWRKHFRAANFRKQEYFFWPDFLQSVVMP